MNTVIAMDLKIQPQASIKSKMIKKTITKDDGRLLIYYSFSADETANISDCGGDKKLNQKDKKTGV